MKASEVLRKATAEIESRGWWQGEFGSDSNAPQDCSVCALGAIRAALTGSPWGPVRDSEDAPVEYLTRVIRAGSTWAYVDSWNDWSHQTEGRVLSTFEQAAVLAESEGN